MTIAQIETALHLKAMRTEGLIVNNGKYWEMAKN